MCHRLIGECVGETMFGSFFHLGASGITQHACLLCLLGKETGLPIKQRGGGIGLEGPLKKKRINFQRVLKVGG